MPIAPDPGRLRFLPALGFAANGLVWVGFVQLFVPSFLLGGTTGVTLLIPVVIAALCRYFGFHSAGLLRLLTAATVAAFAGLTVWMGIAGARFLATDPTSVAVLVVNLAVVVGSLLVLFGPADRPEPVTHLTDDETAPDAAEEPDPTPTPVGGVWSRASDAAAGAAPTRGDTLADRSDPWRRGTPKISADVANGLDETE